MDIDELNKELKSIQDLYNNSPIEEFEGRSPSEMAYILYKPFDSASPFQFKKHADKELLQNIPFIKLTHYFLQLIRDQEPLKLTVQDNLPVKIVKKIYEQRILTEEFIETGISKLYKERDSYIVHTTRIVSELARLIKRRNNKMTLTNNGRKILEDDDIYGLFKELFKAYTTRFNWAYNDGYGDNPVGRLGFALTLEQLIKYGDKERQDTFYGEKYLKAFPTLLEYARPLSFKTREQDIIDCFSLRTFNRFMDLFGLIKLRETGKYSLEHEKFIKKTNILDNVIEFQE